MTNTDKIKIFLLIVIAISSSIFIYNVAAPKGNKKDDVVKSDALKFKEEYEKYNNTKDASGQEYVNVSIDEDNIMYYASFDEIKELLTSGTGVIYFGIPMCPWCRNAVPVLVNAASSTGLDKIYYFNAYEIRDKKSLDEDGKIITEKEGTKEYYELVSLLQDVLPVYDGLNDENIKRLYFPTVIFVRDGKIVGTHMDTVSSQENPLVPLNDEQTKELTNIYVSNIMKVLDDACDKSC